VGLARYEFGEGFTGFVAKSVQGFNIASRNELETLTIDGKHSWQGKYDAMQWPSGQREFRNCIALPLRIKGQCLGLIKVENKQPSFGDRFSADDYQYFETIANVVALAIENARLHLQTQNQLKAIAAKAAHRIHNQATNYDAIELALAGEFSEQEALDPKHLQSILERLRATTVNLKRMTDEFKNYGKPLQLERTNANINKIILDEVWLAHSPEGTQIQVGLADNLPLVLVDGPRFAEAIKELLRNSIRAIGKGPGAKGAIRVSTALLTPRQAPMEPSGSDPKSSFVKISLVDNGPGFPEGFPVFEPFHSTDPNSTGLGLATVKELILAHGGSITVKSGIGAHIEIVLPIQQQM